MDDLITCKSNNCTRKFTPYYRNGVLTSKYCPACSYKRLKGSDKVSENISPNIANNSAKSNKKRRNPKQKAMALADKWFSRYIRLKFSVNLNDVIVCKCYTCGKYYNIKNIDCGHYHNRGNKLTRYDHRNARPQCKNCNRYNSGRHTVFGDKLIQEIGSESFENLRKLALGNGNDSELYYKEIASEYRKQFKLLVASKRLKPWS